MDWMNNDLSGYINAKEKIVFDVRKNENICALQALLISLVWALIFGYFFTGIFLAVGHANMGIIGLVLLFICLFVLFVYVFYSSNRSVRYILTDQGIYSIGGLIFKRMKFVAYNRITDISMKVGPFERLWGCGSVGVATASAGNAGAQPNELDVVGVQEYQDIRTFIRKKIK